MAAYQVLVERYWTRVHARLHAEHVAQLRTLAAGGPQRLLASLQSPWIRWRPPVLEVLVPTDYDVPLNGRGIKASGVPYNVDCRHFLRRFRWS